MALTQQQKSSIRRHLRYGNIGLSINATGGGTLGANAGWRFFGEWGDLEIRMDSLAPIDEATLTGNPYGLIVLQGLDPNNGDSLSLLLSGGGMASPQTITTVASNMNRDQFALAVAAQIAQNAVVNAAGIIALAPISGGRSGITNPLSEIEFTGKSTFSISVSSATGNVAANIVANGSNQTDVFQTISKTNYYGFLQICNQLYSQIGTANDRMGIDKADVFTARKSEYKDRRAAYKDAVDEMADFLVARVNPQPLNGGRNNVGSI